MANIENALAALKKRLVHRPDLVNMTSEQYIKTLAKIKDEIKTYLGKIDSEDELIKYQKEYCRVYEEQRKTSWFNPIKKFRLNWRLVDLDTKIEKLNNDECLMRSEAESRYIGNE